MSVPAPQDPLRLLQIATSHSEQLDNSLNRQAEMGPCQWPVYAIDLWDREWELRPGGWWFGGSNTFNILSPFPLVQLPYLLGLVPANWVVQVQVDPLNSGGKGTNIF